MAYFFLNTGRIFTDGNAIAVAFAHFAAIQARQFASVTEQHLRLHQHTFAFTADVGCKQSALIFGQGRKFGQKSWEFL